jgi:hypothetical protein
MKNSGYGPGLTGDLVELVAWGGACYLYHLGLAVARTVSHGAIAGSGWMGWL